ncbi:M23 family metallopeptidase [uncultured Zoogloea sp.]|uniref:M23 family metallopeptidase n=1 Tax=uncultured Zoogloea sp. TaxID=160237 RepID=UPI002615DCAD|nr:M23 family metallopeptidase [uncultured Zoogloea sp.]
MMNRVMVLALLAGASATAVADTCMVSPTSKEQVSGRFGKFREGGAANFGSGNAKPHMHDGLDFSTSGTAAPLYATTAGTVIWAKLRGSAGNTVMIKRDNGQIAIYYHLSAISVKEGDKVQAGQQIGLSGNTGMKPGGAVHLHFVYGVPNSDDARAKTFSADAAKNPAFKPSQLPNAISKKDFGYATDPSPYFCKTYPIQNDGLHPVLGGDTMAQYNKLFGAAPPMGVPPTTQFDPVQVAAANGDALQAASKGATSIANVLNDADGYGSLPSPPLGDYETMSPAEMLSTEAKRRFTDAEWNTNIVKVSSRALWVDYLRALGVSSYLNEAIRMKKERVEALMALYTSQKLAGQKARVVAAQERAQRADVARAIK